MEAGTGDCGMEIPGCSSAAYDEQGSMVLVYIYIYRHEINYIQIIRLDRYDKDHDNESKIVAFSPGVGWGPAKL